MKRFVIGFILLFFVNEKSTSASEIQIGPNGEFLVHNKPFFPIMQWMQSSFRIRTQAKYGINLFCVPGNSSSTAKAWCDSAQASNVFACCSFKPDDVSLVKDHPALFGWFFGDEPDLAGHEINPDSIQRQYAVIKKEDPDHPAFLTLTSRFYSEHSLPAWMNGSDSLYYHYPKYTDVIGFDLYPVYGWCRPDWIYQVGDAITELKEKYMNENKPVYAWIECGKTSSKWCDNSDRSDDDGPYPYEIEAQVWLAIIHGAKAIGYFTHSWECPDYTQWCVSDEQIATITRINAKLTAMTNIICSPDAKTTVTVNATGVDGPGGRIDACVKQLGDTIYIIAAHVLNYKDAAPVQVATITIDNMSDTVMVYGENRYLYLAEKNAINDTFSTEKPVHVYAFGLNEQTPVNPHRRNDRKLKKNVAKIDIPLNRSSKETGYDLKGAKIPENAQNPVALQPLIRKFIR